MAVASLSLPVGAFDGDGVCCLVSGRCRRLLALAGSVSLQVSLVVSLGLDFDLPRATRSQRLLPRLGLQPQLRRTTMWRHQWMR